MFKAGHVARQRAFKSSKQQLQSTEETTRKHWIQRITFAAETNAADTHTHTSVGDSRDGGIMRLCARIILHIIGDLLHNWANPA